MFSDRQYSSSPEQLLSWFLTHFLSYVSVIKRGVLCAISIWFLAESKQRRFLSM